MASRSRKTKKRVNNEQPLTKMNMSNVIREYGKYFPSVRDRGFVVNTSSVPIATDDVTNLNPVGE